MSKLTAEEVEELIHRAEDSRRAIKELKDKLHQSHLETATEKARADKLEKDAKRLYPSLLNTGASGSDPSSMSIGSQPPHSWATGGDQAEDIRGSRTHHPQRHPIRKQHMFIQSA